MTLEILLSDNYVAIVDDNDLKRPWRYTWHAVKRRRSDGTIRAVYAARNHYGEDGKRRLLLLHRFLLGVTDPAVEVDHKDGNTLNYRRKNLRKATDLQTAQNANIRRDNTSGIKGVSWSKEHSKWVVRIQAGNKRLFIGLFGTLEKAATAREKAARTHHKEFAYEHRTRGTPVHVDITEEPQDALPRAHVPFVVPTEE
jgi:hypothetical protein